MIDAVLAQVKDIVDYVTAYSSSTWNKQECNHCLTDHEQQAVRFFMEYYKQYLLGKKYTARSEHQVAVQFE